MCSYTVNNRYRYTILLYVSKLREKRLQWNHNEKESSSYYKSVIFRNSTYNLIVQVYYNSPCSNNARLSIPGKLTPVAETTLTSIELLDVVAESLI